MTDREQVNDASIISVIERPRQEEMEHKLKSIILAKASIIHLGFSIKDIQIADISPRHKKYEGYSIFAKTATLSGTVLYSSDNQCAF